MTQVLVTFDAYTQTSDLAVDSKGHISLEAGLETASLYSIGSRRRARPSDNVSNPYGWWADNYPDVEGDQFGCLLWVVKSKGKLTTAGIRQATLAVESGFEWMLVDGVASSVAIEVEREDPDTLKMAVRITRPDGESYAEIWRVHENGI